MLELGEEGVIAHIKTIGLYRNKAKNVIKLSRILVDRVWRRSALQPRGAAIAARRGAQDGQRGAQHVVALPGAGGGYAYLPRRQPHRHLPRASDVDAVERAIEDNVPVEFQRHAHHWLILHGRYTCKARKCPPAWHLPSIKT